MRSHASVMHLDLDAFFASVEQRDKPSLRGKPVIVGGVGNRGVVSTASYEARAYGVRSAMSTREARARCGHAAFLFPRFHAYQEASRAFMGVLAEISPAVEPLSLDEAYVDLAQADLPDLSTEAIEKLALDIARRTKEATGGLTVSIGAASSRFLAKVASDLRKPRGITVVAPGTERDALRPLDVSVIPGIGPATSQRLRQLGVTTVADLEAIELDELVHTLGNSHGHALYRLARAEDDRPVVGSREAKSVSVEGTYDTDISDRNLLRQLVASQAADVSRRLRKHGLAGRTITLKVRLYDFTTISRSTTLAGPTDQPSAITRAAHGLLDDLHGSAEIDTSAGVRLLGVGVSGLADWIQDDLFATHEPEPEPEVELPLRRHRGQWFAGQDVVHTTHGRGWVWGAGRTVVTVRFETADTPPGPVRSFSVDDPDLSPWRTDGDET